MTFEQLKIKIENAQALLPFVVPGHKTTLVVENVDPELIKMAAAYYLVELHEPSFLVPRFQTVIVSQRNMVQIKLVSARLIPQVTFKNPK